MPRDTLTREQVVTAAIEILDAEGLDGLNMRALGRRLGSAATAVYWHVEGKANLIALAGDQAWGEVTLPDPAAAGWRAAAAAMATGLYAMLTRHPWVVQAFGSYPLFGPGKARHDDHLLAVYEAAGSPAGKADQAMAAPRELRTSFVSLMSHRGISIEEIARLVGHASTRTTEIVYRRELRPVITTGAEIMDQLFTGT